MSLSVVRKIQIQIAGKLFLQGSSVYDVLYQYFSMKTCRINVKIKKYDAIKTRRPARPFGLETPRFIWSGIFFFNFQQNGVFMANCRRKNFSLNIKAGV